MLLTYIHNLLCEAHSGRSGPGGQSYASVRPDNPGGMPRPPSASWAWAWASGALHTTGSQAGSGSECRGCSWGGWFAARNSGRMCGFLSQSLGFYIRIPRSMSFQSSVHRLTRFSRSRNSSALSANLSMSAPIYARIYLSVILHCLSISIFSMVSVLSNAQAAHERRPRLRV